MNLGISTASLYPLETELALEEVGKAGVKNTEIFFNAESELKDSFIDILLCIKEKYNMNITAVHPAMSLAESYMLFSAYDRRYYEGLKQYRRYSEVAKALGAKYLIMHGGKPNGVLNDEEYCQRYMALNAETGQNGVTVLQENVVNYRSGDIEFMRSMKDILGDDAKFCLDIKQCIRCGYVPMDLIEEFYDNIKHFHISDHSVAGDCLLPLSGKFDFKGLFDFLKQREYEGALMTEVYRYAYKEYYELFNAFGKLKDLSR